MRKALGMVECVGLCAAVAIADAMGKAGNVSVIDIEIVDEFTTVKIEGDIAAVEAACKAGVAVAHKMRGFLASWIIPRPNPDTAFFTKEIEAGQKYVHK
ncbi:MAG: BMC domain-containing protein [Lachnospiraceae bacterium]|nr:BMC domain-containing protein [Lachnospiraceae bacterium]